MISLASENINSDINDYIAAQKVFLTFTEEVYPFDCYLRELGYNIFFMKVLLTITTPIFLSILTSIVWILIHIFLSLIGRPKPVEMTIDSILISFFLIANLMFPAIMRRCFSFFNCVALDSKREKLVVIYSPDIVCWQREHYQMLLTSAIPGLCIWFIFSIIYIGFLLFSKRNLIKKIIKASKARLSLNKQEKEVITYIQRFRNMNIFEGGLQIRKKRIEGKRRSVIIGASVAPRGDLMANINLLIENNIETNSSSNQANKLTEINLNENTIALQHQIISLRKNSLLDMKKLYSRKSSSVFEIEIRRSLMLKYLYRGYSEQYFYWEILTYLNQIILILIGILKHNFDPDTLGLILIMLIGTSIILQLRVKPYITDFFNNLQTFSLLTQILIVCCFILIKNLKFEGDNFSLVISFISLNSFFLIFWSQQMWKQLLKKSKAFECLKNRVLSILNNVNYSRVPPTEE